MANDPPPPNEVTGLPWAQQIPADQLRARIDQRAGGSSGARRDDPGAQPPRDPLDLPGDVSIVYRDIPIISSTDGVTPGSGWDPPSVLTALQGHLQGLFDASGQLYDSVIADPRVTATLASRLSGLFGREVQFKAADDSVEAKECLVAWKAHWPCIVSQLPTVLKQKVLAGFSTGQLNWDTSGDVWYPYLTPWHFRYIYYNWDVRKYVALTLDGQRVIYPGDAKWCLYSDGEYRAWMNGAIRAVAYPWLLRAYAQRDMSRASERHGMPIIKVIVPAAADKVQREAFQVAMSKLGQETAVMLPKGTDGINSYDLELLESQAGAWEIFPGLIDRCDMDIILALLFQNLTTEVKGGSFAAASAHMDIRQSGIEADNASMGLFIYQQIARPFAWLNWGNADLAPYTCWDVEPKETYDSQAARFYQFGQALQILRQGGMQFTDENALRDFARKTFGLKLPDTIELGDPDNGAGTGAAGVQDSAATKQLKGDK